jgi:glycosyltransferase involved in cell wall biosynthesis
MTSIGQYGYYIINSLAHSGVFERITVLTQVAPDTQAELGPGVKVERLWRHSCLNTSWQIAIRLRQLRPDLVWYNLGASVFGRSPLVNLLGMLNLALSRMAGLPSIITMHEMVEQADLRTLCVHGGLFASWGLRLITFLITRADVVCVTLHRHMEWLAIRYPGTNFIHIPHGVLDSPQILDGSSDWELLIFNHFAPFKGLELLIDAFCDLYVRYPSLRLTVAGAEHPRFPDYLNQVKLAFGEHPAIRWLGYIPETEVRNVFARATIVVLPYLATTGASSVLYRAAGWGRPVVASDLPELRAAAEEENLWIEFCPSNNKVDLVAALERLLTDLPRRAAQARHNYYSVMRRLTLAHTSQAYLRAFDLALAAHQSNIRIPIPHQSASEVL